MTNTKKYLSAGVVLAIALFAAVQVSAMESGRRVNPYLTAEEKQLFERRIKGEEALLDPKSPWSKHTSEESKKRARKQLENYEKAYYGNEPMIHVGRQQ